MRSETKPRTFTQTGGDQGLRSICHPKIFYWFTMAKDYPRPLASLLSMRSDLMLEKAM